MAILAENDLMIVRKNISSFKPEELEKFRTAMKKFMAIRDNRGYNFIAGFHGTPEWWCWHHEGNYREKVRRARFFLPWHRAYLKYFEDYLRDHDPSVAIPWWDWTSPLSHKEGVPKAYREETADNKPNPLLKYHIVVLRHPKIVDSEGREPRGEREHPDLSLDEDTTRDPYDPNGADGMGGLPTVAIVQNALKKEDFGAFSDYLEDQIHDKVHGWCNGHMSDPTTAAYDPLFWAHHCNIDRLWWIWQLMHGNASMPTNLLDYGLAPFSYDVKSVLNIYNLGYEYATATGEVTLV
jgi:tyrosinase